MLEEGNGTGKWANGVLERPFGRGLNFQISVNDVETLSKRLVHSGHQLQIPVKEISYRRGAHAVHVRQCLVLDPDGYLLTARTNPRDLGQIIVDLDKANLPA